MINTLKATSITLFLLAARLADGERRNDDGQATAEYALVLLGAAAIAMAIVSWVTNMNPIEMLLDKVLGGLLKKVF
ncbi:MAG TPA: DUF4244 domain-containing protein [Acidimicrobiales bacterium]|nr:DUF4244 domain-containing protein [Acidimicrobiales bacterium]